MSALGWALAAAAAVAVVLAAVWMVRWRRSAAASDEALPRTRAEDPPAAPRRPGALPPGVRQLGVRLQSLLSGPGMSEEAWREMEEELIAADVGVEASRRVVAAVRRAAPSCAEEAREVIRAELNGILAGADRRLRMDGEPAILVLVGVNGAGKTTTAAKLAARLNEAGRRPIVGAADTYRPAADTQLITWAERAGVQVVSGRAGGDPAAVAYDALQAGRARGAGAVIVDTAGRLQTKRNLMEELSKIIRVLGRDGDEVSEVLLVMDATTGQNGLSQARHFAEAGATGIVLTKMDGSAKGGLALAVERELSVPVKFIGVGEGLEDLIPFDGAAFVDALLAPPQERSAG